MERQLRYLSQQSPLSQLRRNTVPLEGKIANAAADALDVQIPEAGREVSRLTGCNESLTGLRRWPSRNGTVETGIEVARMRPSLLSGSFPMTFMIFFLIAIGSQSTRPTQNSSINP